MRGLVTVLWLLICTGPSVGSQDVVAELGGDSFLRFTSSSTADLFRLEREALGRCGAFPKPVPVATNIDARNGFIYVGGNTFMTTDYTTAGYRLLSCTLQDKTASKKQSLECPTLYEGKSMRLSPDQEKREMVYVEPDRLIHFEATSGSYDILRLQKDEPCEHANYCGIRAVPLLSGNLADFCTVDGSESQSGFQVSSLGNEQFLVACAGKDIFSIIRLYAGSSTEKDELSALVMKSGSLEHDSSIVFLGGTTLLGVNGGNYSVFDCSGISCQKLSNGSFDQVDCLATSKSECVKDSRCGFCEETGTCFEGSADGPCFGHCSIWTTGDSVRTLPPLDPAPGIPESQFIEIGHRVVMHYIAELGKYELFAMTTNSPALKSRCPPLTSEPIYSGHLPYKSYNAVRYKEGAVLFINPSNGHYAIWQCQTFSFEGGISTAAPCSTAVTGIWSQAVGKHEIVTIGNKTLNYDHDTGSLLVFGNEDRDALHSSSDGSEDQAFAGVFSSTPLVHNYRPELKGHHLVGIGQNYILEYSRGTAEYRVWVFDSKRLTLDGPGARGTFPHTLTNQLLYMGSDRIMSVSDEFQYIMLRFDSSMLTTPSALPLSAIGRASLTKGSCEYHSCRECTSDSACGWCSSQNKCIQGNLHEPCNAGQGSSCASWMYDYCAASSCTSWLFQSQCEEGAECMWCEQSGLCKHTNSRCESD